MTVTLIVIIVVVVVLLLLAALQFRKRSRAAKGYPPAAQGGDPATAR
jgi:heme/copper-type cytochrome/quinol oxidase subunit 2